VNCWLHVVPTGEVTIEELPQAKGEGLSFVLPCAVESDIRASLNEMWFRTFLPEPL
jgi:hypothetical protein